jgi:hypothetical protein
VFAKNYKLKPLNEVQKYSMENKHLPDVPSAADIKKDGINVADMDAIFLKKIEEAYMYIFQQQKRLDEQDMKIKEMQEKLDKITK